MDIKKYSVSFSFGITSLTLFILFAILHWNQRVVDMGTFELMYIAVIAFCVGIGASIVLYFMNLRTDFNLSSVSIVAFCTLLYSFFGDVPFGYITIGTILFVFTISFGISILIGVIIYIIIQ